MLHSAQVQHISVPGTSLNSNKNDVNVFSTIIYGIFHAHVIVISTQDDLGTFFIFIIVFRYHKEKSSFDYCTASVTVTYHKDYYNQFLECQSISLEFNNSVCNVISINDDPPSVTYGQNKRINR